MALRSLLLQARRAWPASRWCASGASLMPVWQLVPLVLIDWNHVSCQVWLDAEMTGLDPQRDRIIEIACLVTDGALKAVFEARPNLRPAARSPWLAQRLRQLLLLIQSLGRARRSPSTCPTTCWPA